MDFAKKTGLDFGFDHAICFWRDEGDPFGVGFSIGIDTDIFFLSSISLEFAIGDDGSYTWVGMCFDLASPFATGFTDWMAAGSQTRQNMDNERRAWYYAARQPFVEDYLKGLWDVFKDDMVETAPLRHLLHPKGSRKDVIERAFYSAAIPKGIEFSWGEVDTFKESSLLELSSAATSGTRDYSEPSDALS